MVVMVQKLFVIKLKDIIKKVKVFLPDVQEKRVFIADWFLTNHLFLVLFIKRIVKVIIQRNNFLWIPFTIKLSNFFLLLSGSYLHMLQVLFKVNILKGIMILFQLYKSLLGEKLNFLEFLPDWHRNMMT